MSTMALYPLRRRAVFASLLALGLLAAAGAALGAGTTAAARPIDINRASKAQLKTLPGIGDAEAEKIIANRPYRSKADLASRNVLPTGTYLSIKQRIIAGQKPAPAARSSKNST